MTRTARALIASRHAETIAQALLAATHAIASDAEAAAEWHALWPLQRDTYRQSARRAIRAEDEAARAVASYEAREVFCRLFAKEFAQLGTYDYSRLCATFDGALRAYLERLSEGPYPMALETRDEYRARMAGSATDEDTETITGHGRY